MKTLKLTKEESKILNKKGIVCIERYGFEIVVKQAEYVGLGYYVTVMNPYSDVKTA